MESEAKELLSLFGQEHLIEDLKQFTSEEISECISQLKRWQPGGQILSHVGYMSKAEKTTKKGAALFLAGGQGSRLGFDGPKGCYPLLGKTLFQRHCEKLSSDASAAILTSHLNHQETVSYFERQNWFGLQKLSFCCQDTLPLLDEQRKWFWMKRGKIAEGPDGNGSVFAAMEKAGVLKRFEDEGVEILHIIPIDNPLADPFDPELASFHEASGADLSLKCIRLNESEEPMGRLVRVDGRLAIREFAELTAEERNSHRYANTGLLIIDLSLARSLAQKKFPLHWAWKETPSWPDKRRFAWKRERFIVDALEFANRAQALLSERNSCYAPLKEKKSIGEIERLLVV